MANNGSKTFFHTNLRFLRERRSLTQEQLCEVFNITRNKLQALESGKTKNPTIEDLLKFTAYFKISIDSLLQVDIRKLSELNLKELQAGNDVYMTGSNIRVLAISVDKDNNENVEYVSVKAKAGYQSGYNDPEYIADLPKYTLPNLPGNGTYRMFPTTGDSMLPIPEGSDVIAQYVQDWKSLKPNTPCIVILKNNQDFVFKLLTIQADETILLKSSNRNYQSYTVRNEEVLEIWKYYKHQTDKLPEPETDLQELKSLILKLGTKTD